MRITLEGGPVSTFLLRAAGRRSPLIRTNWEFPHLASSFGFSPCSCGATDGTSACQHREVREMIAAATARRCRSAGTTHRLRATHSSVTSTSTVRRETCAQRRFDFGLVGGLAIPPAWGE
jgi:hypothetical protein